VAVAQDDTAVAAQAEAVAAVQDAFLDDTAAAVQAGSAVSARDESQDVPGASALVDSAGLE